MSSKYPSVMPSVMTSVLAAAVVVMAVGDRAAHAAAHRVAVRTDLGTNYNTAPDEAAPNDTPFSAFVDLSGPGSGPISTLPQSFNYTDATGAEVGATISMSADAIAERFNLRSSASFSVSGYDPAAEPAVFRDFVRAEAKASWTERITIADVTGDVYLAPLFHLTGSLGSMFSLADYQLTMESDSTPGLVQTLSTGFSPFPVGAESIDVLTLAVAAVEFFPMEVETADVKFELRASVLLQNELPAASGAADLSSTAEFLGFMVFDDAELTVPYTGPITVTDGDGEDISDLLIPVPEPSSALLLVIGAAGVLRRRFA